MFRLILTCLFVMISSMAFAETSCLDVENRKCKNFGGTVFCGYSCQNFGGTIFCGNNAGETCKNFGGTIYCGTGCENFGGTIYCATGGIGQPAYPAKPAQ